MTLAAYKPGDILKANDLNTSLNYGDKQGGALDNTPIGQTAPAPGKFNRLELTQSPLQGDASNLVPTTAWVVQALGSVTGGTTTGQVVSLYNATLTGVPTAPTPSLNTNSGQVATTAYVDGTISSKSAPAVVVGTSAACLVGLDANNFLRYETAYPWQSFNHPNPVVDQTLVFDVVHNTTITGLHVDAPGASNSSSFSISLLKNGAVVASSLVGSVGSTAVALLQPAIVFAPGDRGAFKFTATNGAIPIAHIQPVGNYN